MAMEESRDGLFEYEYVEDRDEHSFVFRFQPMKGSRPYGIALFIV